MAADVRSELDRLSREVAALEAIVAGQGAGEATEPRRSRPRRRRLLFALGVLALAALAPAVVLANHSFSDVPTSHTFHTNIANLKATGITTGCTPTTYCPEASVTRGQMAGFLNRGLGRVAEGEGSSVVLNQDGVVVTTASIRTPGAGFVLATVAAMGYTTDTTGCPCEVDVIIELDGDGQTGFFFGDTVQNAAEGGLSYGAMANTQVFTVAAAGVHTVEVIMNRYGTAEVDGDAKVTLLYVPFDGDGNAFDGLEGPGTAKQQLHP